MENYLLDLTTLITLISDICHDDTIGERFGSIDVWKIKNESIYNHIIDDKNDPVLPKLQKIFTNGKLHATILTWNKFNDMICTYGSNTEKERLSELKVNIINENIPIEFQELTGKVWSNENKSTVGIASKNDYVLVTGNVNMLHNALEFDSDLKYLAHRSRCFIGKKFEIPF